jgi:hypothetical protein
MNRLRVGSWLPACILIAVLPLVGACAGGDKKSDAYAQEAWAYFKKLCDEKSGEKIYKTFVGVKSVLVVKPLPAATEKDLFDQYWYGDPYSNASTGDRARLAAARLTYRDAPIAQGKRGNGFDFVESDDSQNPASGRRLVKYSFSPSQRQVQSQELATSPVSRFGISWEDISTPEGRRYWVAGSRLSIIDLTNGTIVAERIGFLIEGGFGSRAGQRRPWQTAQVMGRGKCPDVHDYSDRWFVLKVLNPNEENRDGK